MNTDNPRKYMAQFYTPQGDHAARIYCATLEELTKVMLASQLSVQTKSGPNTLMTCTLWQLSEQGTPTPATSAGSTSPINSSNSSDCTDCTDSSDSTDSSDCTELVYEKTPENFWDLPEVVATMKGAYVK